MKCEICGTERLDLSRHLMSFHNISVKEYKEKYGKGVQDKKINLKRKATNLELHGDENYRNREAIKLSNEIYDGGHSLSDLMIRNKGKKTKKRDTGILIIQTGRRLKKPIYKSMGMKTQTLSLNL